MKLYYKKASIFLFLLFLLVFKVTAQDADKLWSKAFELEKSTIKKIVRKSIPTTFEVYQLDLNLLKSKLNNTPKRKGKSTTSSAILSFPNEKGELEKYQVFEASILEESLQKKHPTIRSFVGKGVNNPGSVIRFSVTSQGFHGMVLKRSGGALYIDPYTTDKESYIVYTKKNLSSVEQFECRFDEFNSSTNSKSQNVSAKIENANDGNLRTFRLAIATTGEYSQFHITNQNATDEEKKAEVLSAIVATMTRVNGIFEQDVALTMVLIANNTDIIFLDEVTDGFSNNDAASLIDESQTVIDSTIGFDNYDIGHTFSTGGGGLAQINSPCTLGKARGITGSSNPTGDPFDIDFVAHEMGHQFGAHHTFNGDAGNCSGDNRNNGTAVEPGSGSTIMAYAGICTPQNVQPSSDDYFHLVSIREIWANISSGSSQCGAITATGNTVPTVDVLANYAIPISTPFVLDANGSDTDGDNLTYTWEQLDIEITTYPLVSTATGGPAFRSISPSTSSMRHFPDQATVIAGDLSNTWEVLPSVERTMRFGVTVRDNNIAGGQTASEETTITFDADSGPFKVTSQDASVTWDAGTAQTVTWDVANTNTSPVNCSVVNILLSIDGGLTYPILVASNVSNDGSYEIVVPNNSTTTGRIKIESVDNVFYAMNSADITIQASEFIMNFASNNEAICSPNTIVYTFTYNTFLGFNEETTFSALNNPDGTTVTFSPTSATVNDTTVEMTISNIENDDIGNHSILVTGTSALTTKTTAVVLDVYSSIVNAPNLVSPENNAVSILKPYLLSWSSDINALNYTIEISLENTFSTTVETTTVNTNYYNPQLLQTNTSYFWRVKAINDCGESSFSAIYNFTTANEVCGLNNSTDTPLSIPDNNSLGVSSIINVTDDKLITDVNVTVNITHPWIGDLTLTLISPNGTSILLVAGSNDNGDNYTNTIFDSEAAVSINSGVAPFTGSFSPLGNLSNFNDEESLGGWTLKVVDGGAVDIGQIENWSIEICGVHIIRDSDNDGVLDDVDLCLNTPTGEIVDTDGCSNSQLGDDDNDGIINALDLCSNTPIGEIVNANGCSDSQLSDDDNDGVINNLDLCPNTPLGTIVGVTGCIVLLSDNFDIVTISETCPDKNNGQILITATETHNYITTINGVEYNFTNTLVVDDLPPGTYDFCFTVIGDSFEQCYTAVIAEGITVSGKSSVTSNKVFVEIEVGTAPFTIFVNGTAQFETNTPVFSVSVRHGDVVEVKTAISCEGVFLKTIELLYGIVAYPNPTKGTFEIVLPVSKKEVTIELYTIYSQLISVKTYPIIYGRVQLNIENKPTGLYIAKVHLDKPITLKIIKQ